MLHGVLLAAVEVMAVYYPHWHRYPKGDEWFGADKWKQANRASGTPSSVWLKS